MKINDLLPLKLAILSIFISCKENKKAKVDRVAMEQINPELEKQAILERLNNETKDAFQREYEAWTKNWVHDPNIPKTYADFANSTFPESIGRK